MGWWPHEVGRTLKEWCVGQPAHNHTLALVGPANVPNTVVAIEPAREVVVVAFVPRRLRTTPHTRHSNPRSSTANRVAALLPVAGVAAAAVGRLGWKRAGSAAMP